MGLISELVITHYRVQKQATANKICPVRFNLIAPSRSELIFNPEFNHRKYITGDSGSVFSMIATQQHEISLFGSNWSPLPHLIPASVI